MHKSQMGMTDGNYAVCIDVTTSAGVFGTLAYSFEVRSRLDCLRLVASQSFFSFASRIILVHSIFLQSTTQLKMGWWGKSNDSKESQPESQTKATEAKTFDENTLPPAKKLPTGLQKVVDKSDADTGFFDNVAEG